MRLTPFSASGSSILARLSPGKTSILPLALIVLIDQGHARSGAEVPAPQVHHKVQVSDPESSRRILDAGGKLIADYGSFQIYDTSLPLADLTVRPGVELRDDFNLIALNVGPLETDQAETQSLRRTIGTLAGQHLHLVPFAGPVL